MSLIAVAAVAHSDLALTPTIRAGVADEIRVVSQSGTDPETGLFFFLVTGTDGERFEDALRADHTVRDWTRVSADADTVVYRIAHADGTILLSPMVARLGGLMLEAWSTEQGWAVRLQFPDREVLSELWEYCEAEDITFELRRVFRQEGWTDREPSGLTDAQHEALVTAYECGYFEEPREATLADLAEILGRSTTAVSGRLRRGIGTLVASTLVEDGDGEKPGRPP
ncbi:helix-turn-helix domain-containing protein (plasmid) [Halarchaeum sp. CBA1220]|uniref:helix-turn-helix domain-containing protein n=1 Tax=Halarchaeum sp. CBA1220 TaxID=1853682 RepID=UPI000F3A9A03|nr:helix-turn-helix domain-containing protein [Halarchaeum sp. CBA1220]QLC35382.1 helix-turn-helix domain-containing protein [Halarchaeum sp. CBA1220]